ncbi:MAG: acetolactate decarboxylase [Saprospiraceae bacterium]
MKLIIFILTAIIMASIAQAQEVKTVSEMRKVMMGEDLSTHLLWDSIPHNHLFGISPLGRIEGEITIIDGQIYSSTVNKKGGIVIADSWKVKAPFAVYAHVENWKSIEIELTINNENELQDAIEKIAKENGIDIKKAFPFRIIGNFEKVDFHIISKPKREKEHNHELHDKAKKRFSLTNASGEILGFYSQNHIGVFTHKGHYIHTHFIDNQRKNMGHIDDIKINQKTTILLPIQ